jgi:hypothetical protein
MIQMLEIEQPEDCCIFFDSFNKTSMVAFPCSHRLCKRCIFILASPRSVQDVRSNQRTQQGIPLSARDPTTIIQEESSSPMIIRPNEELNPHGPYPSNAFTLHALLPPFTRGVRCPQCRCEAYLNIRGSLVARRSRFFGGETQTVEGVVATLDGEYIHGVREMVRLISAVAWWLRRPP